ncbi:hypothetical protein [Microbacterium sp. P04]|uniref:hypothetical protein n=1 Tax=Microbacterium sp. P04 TaxID=3366947 RepID=UPI0037468624
MAIEVNEPALSYARDLIRRGKVVRDQRDWSEVAPTTQQENEVIERDGWSEYARWHLGVDPSENPETKKAYSFPFGDFSEVHRSGVIAGESRAGQYHHTEVEAAFKSLLELIDEG